MPDVGECILDHECGRQDRHGGTYTKISEPESSRLAGIVNWTNVSLLSHRAEQTEKRCRVCHFVLFLLGQPLTRGGYCKTD